jgi:tetratricopeptide (TPR) repeat protein
MSLLDHIIRGVRHVIARYHYGWGLSHRYVANTTGIEWEYETAARYFSKAIHWDPGFARAYLDRGILNWRELDDSHQAVHDLTLAYEIDGDLAEARFNRGVAHQEMGAYDRAIADFEAYLDVGEHPHWRDYAEAMIKELQPWVAQTESNESHVTHRSS